MIKVLVLTIFLASSSTFGLVDKLYEAENDCHSGCHSTYADNVHNFNACKQGCDYKLHHEECANQCKLLSIEEQIQASCLVGCSMYHLESKSLTKISEQTKSIILIRLRQRPLLQLSSSKNDPVAIFNDIIKQFKDNAKVIEQSKELQPVIHIVKNIPFIQLPNTNNDNSIQIKRIIIQREEKLGYLSQLIKNFRQKCHEIICQQPKLSFWIVLIILIITTIIILYLTLSLCYNTPHDHTLSIRAQELIFEENDTPAKINLTNI